MMKDSKKVDKFRDVDGIDELSKFLDKQFNWWFVTSFGFDSDSRNGSGQVEATVKLKGMPKPPTHCNSPPRLNWKS